MRIEVWNGYKIRFIEKDSGEWWAVVKDVAEALGFRDARAAVRNISPKFFHTHKVCMEDISRKMLIVSEKGLHRLIMRSNKPEAEEFQDWVCDVLIQFRQKSGLESYQVFRMLDKDHQKDMMALLWKGLNKPEKVIYIQANIIANKAIERKYKAFRGIRKKDMTPEMLADRQPILEDTVQLILTKEKFGLNVSVSDTIYSKYN